MTFEIISRSNLSDAPSDSIRIAHKNAVCYVYLFGATVYSWKPAGYEERLWTSSISVMDGSAPIRGGVPIAFPQFALQGSLPLHGFARVCNWEFAESESISNDSYSRAVFRLRDNEYTRSLWNHKFELIYTVTVSDCSLRLEICVENVDVNAFQFTACLHTYFKTVNIRNCAVGGLRNKTFVDKVDGCTVKLEENVKLVLTEETIPNDEYYIDRIYQLSGQSGSRNVDEVIRLDDGNAVPFEPAHYFNVIISNDFTDVVVFNPWKEGKKGPVKGPDFDDDGYNYMVCNCSLNLGT